MTTLAPRPAPAVAALPWSALVSPALALVAVLLLQEATPAAFGARASAPVGQAVQLALASAAWLAATLLLIRFVNIALWGRVLPRYASVRVPGLLRQLVAVVLLVLGIALMLNQVWGVALSAVLATTGVLGIVFGLALRNVLADFFSGIALNVEQPFHLDDFIVLRLRGHREPVVGTVREINWRSTRLLTPEDNLVVVPNSAVSAATVENLSFPSPVSELELEIVLEWDVDPTVSEPVLHAAMVETWATGATSGSQPSKCRMCRLDGGGVAYKIVYLIDPRRKPKGPARHALLSNVQKHLRWAGLRPAPGPEGALRDVAGPPQRRFDAERLEDQSMLLERVPLFAMLTSTERATLAATLIVRRAGQGTEVVRSGEPGSSMFIVVAGVVEVLGPAGVQSPAATDGGAGAPRLNVMGPGAVFGEMSLLTGAARTATVRTLCPAVLYEVPHTAISGLLQSRPPLAEALARVVAEHQRQDAAAARTPETDTGVRRRMTLTSTIVDRMRGFMGR